MSLEHHDTDTWSRPLLPATLETQMIGWGARMLGAVLVATSGVGWIVLLTWRVAGPDAMGRDQAWSRNLLGAPGAFAGDVMLGGLGVACVFCLLAPLVWGIELATQERLARARSKVLLFPLSVLAVAGGCAAMPSPAAWPLIQGLGGFVGGIVLALAAHAVAPVSPRDSVWIAGIVLFACGAAGLTHVVGLSARDVLPGVSRARGGRSGRKRVPQPEVSIVSGRQLPSLSHAPVRDRHDREQPPSLSHDPGRRSPMAPARAASGAFGPYAPRELSEPGFDPDSETPPPLDADPAQPRYSEHHRGEPQRHPQVGQEREQVWHDPLPDLPPLEIYHDGGTDDRRELAAGRDIARRLVRSADETGGSGAAMPTSVSAAVSGAMSGLAGAISRGRPAPAYRRPGLNILRRSPTARMSDDLTQTVLRGTARLLEDVLADYDVRGAFRSIRAGPVVTTFEFEPVAGVKAARVVALADDIARAMNTASARVATVPGRSSLTIELPNPRREAIAVRDILETDVFRQPGLVLPLAIGKTISGDPVVLDLTRLPHVLVAGSPGAPPVTALHAMVLSLVHRHGPADCRLLMIDPRMIDLSVYMGIPHLVMPVVSDPAKGLAALSWAAAQMEERSKQFATIGVRSLDVFNNRVRNARKRGERAGRTVQTGYDAQTGRAIFERETLEAEPLAHIVVMIAELADLMMVDPRGVEQVLVRLARGGAGVGIHVVAATDRPTADIVTGPVKQALAARLCFKLTSRLDSRAVLDDGGAEQLLSEGDMLVHDGISGIVRMHAAIASMADVEAVVSVLAEQGGPDYTADYPEILADAGAPGVTAPAFVRGSADDLYECAVAMVVRSRTASPALLQQRLRIDLHHARALIERMQRDGLITGER